MKNLKQWLVENCELAAEATDEEVTAAAQKAIEEKKLTLKQYTELSAVTEEESSKSRVEAMIEKTIEEKFSGTMNSVEKMLEKINVFEKPGNDGAGLMEDVTKNLPEGNPSSDELLQKRPSDPRVMKATERYSNSKKALCYEYGDRMGRAGQPVRYFESGRYKGIDELSEAEWAKCGAFFKLQMVKLGAPASQVLTEHDIQLIKESLHEDRWVGPVFGTDGELISARKFSELEIKTVLDESGSSGGASAVPEYYDNALITVPLLHGELFPYVEVVPVSRGSSADSAAIGTPTFVSTASGTTVSEFSTTSFVSAFDTSFYPATCAITFGLDFLSDAVPNFAQLVMNQIGQEHLRWLDEQIAVGDGTTEPEGIFTASGTAVTGTGTSTFSSFSHDDILQTIFTIDKAHRSAFGGANTRLVMNDSQYKELLQINVNSEANHPTYGVNAAKEYMIAGYPVSVQNNISNGNLAICNLRGYRLYRRQGLQFMTETAGKTLALDNEMLLLGRTRWGGQITRTAYIGELTT